MNDKRTEDVAQVRKKLRKLSREIDAIADMAFRHRLDALAVMMYHSIQDYEEVGRMQMLRSCPERCIHHIATVPIGTMYGEKELLEQQAEELT